MPRIPKKVALIALAVVVGWIVVHFCCATDQTTSLDPREANDAKNTNRRASISRTRINVSGMLVSPEGPVAKAAVQAHVDNEETIETETDSSGRFYFSNLRRSEITFSAYRDGYEPAVRREDFSNSEFDIAFVELRLNSCVFRASVIVTDSEEKPLSTAGLRTLSNEFTIAQTNQIGRAVVCMREPTSVALVYAPGYAVTTVALHLGDNEVRLAQGAVISGRTLDVTGLPLEGVIVRLNRSRSAHELLPTSALQTTSGKGGEFLLDAVPPGEYDLVAYGLGRYSRRETIAAKKGDVLANIEIELIGGHAVRGVVTDSGGQRLADLALRVQSYEVGEGFASMVVLTDIRGEFEVVGMPAGRFKVSASGYKDALFVVDGQADTNTIVLKPADYVRGRVVKDGRIVAGAEVEMFLSEMDRLVLVDRALTGPKGEFSFRIVDHEGLVLIGSSSGAASEPMRPDLNVPTMLELRSTISIRGEIKDTSGVAVSDALISIVDDGGRPRARVVSNLNGLFDFNVPPGTYSFSVFDVKRGCTELEFSSNSGLFKVPESGQWKALIVRRALSEALSGVVVESLSRQPLGDARVSILPGKASRDASFLPCATSVRSTTTNSSGRFSFDGLAAGEYWLTVAGDPGWRKRALVRTGEFATLDVSAPGSLAIVAEGAPKDALVTVCAACVADEIVRNYRHGGVVVDGLEPGEYVVGLLSRGSVTQRQAVSVRAGERSDVALTWDARVEGRVVSSVDGSGIASAWCIADYPHSVWTTDADGRFVAPRNLEEGFLVRCFANGYRIVDKRVTRAEVISRRFVIELLPN